MTDDRKNRGGADRARVSAEQGYEVGYFAKKHGISRDAARKLLDEVGSNREKLNAAAAKLTKR